MRVQTPSPFDRGDYVGDIFFGDPENSTRGTHRWNGSQWVELPSEQVALMELLVEARTRAENLESALNLIGTECSTFTGPATCVEDGSRTRDGEYADERWCHQCIAREALGETL